MNRISGQPAQISIVTCPQSHRELALKVVSQLNLLISFDPYVIQYQTPYSALHYAYELGKCMTVGLPEDFDPEDIFGAALWVDFNAAGFRISLLDFSEYGCIRHATSDTILIGDDIFPMASLFCRSTFFKVNVKFIGWNRTTGNFVGNRLRRFS